METTQWKQAGAARLQRWWRSPWLHPLNDIDSFDELIAPWAGRWALGRLLARVVAVHQETADARILELAPNHLWPGFVAGQHIQVDWEVGGRRLQRSYSLCSDPADRRRIAITVKRQPGGRCSTALHEQLRPGHVLRLSPPRGDFVLPDPVPQRLLMISAGSGITPLRAMLHALERAGYQGDIAFLHVARSPGERIFGAQIDALAARWRGLRPHWFYTAGQGRPAAEALLAPVPDHAQRHTLLCGPESLMRPLRSRWQQQGLAARLSWEAFGLAREPQPQGQPRSISTPRLPGGFVAEAGEPLLLAAERAGLSPQYGCRKGICHSCRYRKRGLTRNLLTGETCAEPDVLVQLCIHAAESDVELTDL